jgi:hypothetical protein
MFFTCLFLAACVPPSGPRAAQEATDQDYAAMLAQLGISAVRPGVDGMNPNAPNYANTDEAKANPYTSIPPVLLFKDGRPVKTSRDWVRRRREIVEDLDREIYGRVPRHLPGVQWHMESQKEGDVDGIATTTKKLVGHVDNGSCPSISVDMRVTLTLPSHVLGKVPAILEFGFGWFPPPKSVLRQVLAKGWGFAVFDPTSVQADDGGGLTKGIIGLANKGKARKPDDWGALKAWAWGASRVLDYLETDPAVDAKRVGIEGISRYGKAAAVAMAYEPRFAVAFVGSSGQGGVKIWRRNFGETVENVASSGEYHWMAGNYIKYAGPLTPNDMPVDGHELLALSAPRPVFVGVGSLHVEGIWIDPTGTFMAASLASPVWDLLGKKGLSVNEIPPEGTPLIDGDLAFSQHHGGHTNEPNWPTFMEFASRYLAPP